MSVKLKIYFLRAGYEPVTCGMIGGHYSPPLQIFKLNLPTGFVPDVSFLMNVDKMVSVVLGI